MQKSLVIKIRILASLLVAFPLLALDGQTRFSRPDTTPDYASYRHMEECIAAIERLSQAAQVEDPLWEDSVQYDVFKRFKPLPEPVVKYSRECLANIDLDAITFKDIHEFARILLIADRDADVDRLYEKFADSIKADATRRSFIDMLLTYAKATPMRLEKVLVLQDVGLSQLPPDSVIPGVLLRAVVASMVADAAGKDDLAIGLMQDLLNILDTLSPSIKAGPMYQGIAQQLIFPASYSLMTQEAIDSLSTSTDAYRKYLDRLWWTVVGDQSSAAIQPVGAVAPQLAGHYWYTNTGGDGLIKRVDSLLLPSRGRPTLLLFIQAGCHSTYMDMSYSHGRNNGYANSCYGNIHRIHRIKKLYPELEVVLVSQTFGNFGDGAPMEPRDEADLLAEYFLGFHQLKGNHVVYETEFVRLQRYDNRKVDLETENDPRYIFGDVHLAGKNEVVLVDEKGKIFHFGPVTGMAEHRTDLKLKAVFERAYRQVQ